jgi:peroxin-16
VGLSRQPPIIATFRHHPPSTPYIVIVATDWGANCNVQAGDATDDRGAVHAQGVAGHVLRLHHQEQQRRVANRVGAAVTDIYHSWYASVEKTSVNRRADLVLGRFRESEIASESCKGCASIACRIASNSNTVHSGVQLLSLYHDSLLGKAMAQMPGTRRQVQTPHHRYTKFWTQKSPTYKRLALVLQMIQYTELLWEMAAKRKGEKVRWRVIVLLEVVKAVCRLLLLRLTNSRPLLTPPLPQREIDPSSLEDTSASADGMDTPPNERSVEAENWTMPRTGLSMPSLPDSSDISNYLLSKVLTADDIKPPKALLHRVNGKGELAEALYILRPVIYALAMQHFSGDRKSWRPWLIGVSIEYGARQLAKNDFQERLAGGLRGLTGLEREELKKRGWALGWWMMRGAFYENVTK